MPRGGADRRTGARRPGEAPPLYERPGAGIDGAAGIRHGGSHGIAEVCAF
jgi:hypothetical protein